MASSTFGSICEKRSITLRAPNSGAAEDQMAPIDAQANGGAPVSGMFGMYAATRSPSPTPKAFSPAAIEAVCDRSSPHVQDPSSRDSDACWMAKADGSFPANMCSAQDTRDPGNHVAPGIASLPSTRSPPSENRTPRNSTSEPQNASRSNTDQRHSSGYP